MNWSIAGLIAFGQPPTPAGTQADPRAQAMSTIGLMVLMVVMLYFVMIRPQSKKAKEHAQLLKGLRAGDKVVTSGGVIGVVITVKEKSVSIRSADAKFEVTKAAIAEVTERSGEEKEAS